MILKKINSSHTIRIVKYSDNKWKSVSFKIFTEEEVGELIKKLKKKFKASYENGCRVAITCSDNKGKKKKIEFNYHDLNINDIKSRVYKNILCYNSTIDIKNTRYRIIVQNKDSSQLDVKTFTFNSTLQFKKLYMIIKNKLYKEIEKVKEEEIVFLKTKKKKTTHYVSLMRAGNKERLLQPSRAFSINLPNYSSKEVIEIMNGGEK